MLQWAQAGDMGSPEGVGEQEGSELRWEWAEGGAGSLLAPGGRGEGVEGRGRAPRGRVPWRPGRQVAVWAWGARSLQGGEPGAGEGGRGSRGLGGGRGSRLRGAVPIVPLSPFQGLREKSGVAVCEGTAERQAPRLAFLKYPLV